MPFGVTPTPVESHGFGVGAAAALAHGFEAEAAALAARVPADGFIQWQFNGVNLGDKNVAVVDWVDERQALRATRGVGVNSHVVTIAESDAVNPDANPPEADHWWWDFDDVSPATQFTDRGQRQSHMTAVPNLAGVSTASGMAGRAADRGVGGTGRLIYLPRSRTDLDFGPTDSFSFGVWIYPTSLPNDGYTKGVMGRWAAPKDPPGLDVTGYDGGIHTSYGLCVLNGLANLYMIEPGAAIRTILNTTMTLNAWQLMVGVIDIAGGQMRMGINAAAFTTTAIAQGPRNDISVKANFIFGNPMHTDQTGGMDFAKREFLGRMDRAFVTRRMLTLADRTWLYNAGAGRSYDEALAQGILTP